MNSVQVLLTEDNPSDVELTRESLAESCVKIDLHVVCDGVEALAFLRRSTPEFADAPTPDLILLDLNMPRMDGRQLLQVIKNDPQLKSIPVVVLTSSSAEIDIARSYAEHANCYIPKPVDLDGLRHVVRTIEGFWFTVVKLPPRPNDEPER